VRAKAARAGRRLVSLLGAEDKAEVVRRMRVELERVMG